ncbi:unnamed protein product [Paramecium primaurelia]|uniref:Uncharacterized protein n=1 Tax=Paramecium primaurelia TaxID=5886 RepID=A0A8S1K9T4_PARPR|nr:unnamed protein product [Paramecium primaurelia]
MQSKQGQLYLLSHKSSKSEYIKKTVNPLNYSIPCINCDSLIPAIDVDKHTQLCQAHSPKHSSQFKDQTAMEETDLKLKKLRQSIIIQCKTETNIYNKKYLIRAEELCTQILKLQNFDDKEQRKILDISEEIKMITESYKGVLLVQLFLERLHSLTLVKQQNMKSIIQEKQQLVNNQQKKIIQDLDKQSFNILINKEEQNYVQQCLGYQTQTSAINLRQNEIFRKTQITKFSRENQNKSGCELKSEILTKISSSQCEEEVQGIDDTQNNNNYQRLFYSKCLNLKAQLSNNDPAQKIPLCVLFKEVLSKRISINQWNQFILSAFEKPSQYLEFQKSTLLNQASKFQNSVKQFTINSNFKERLRNLKIV